MEILIDADVIIQAEKGKFDLQAWLMVHARDRVAIAAITVAELWHGVERATGKQRLARRRFLKTILRVLPIIPYTERTAYLHAKLWAYLDARGKMNGYYDLIVAATARVRKYAVATLNLKHFNMVPNLTILKIT